MLVFHRQRLVVFAVPRAGSTSLHRALRPYANIEFRAPPARKHMNVTTFEDWAEGRPKPVGTYRRVAMIRDPLARMVSWYSYRQRAAIAGQENSTLDMTFDAFIRATLLPDPPPAARVGNQVRFLSDASGQLAVDEIFCLEQIDVAFTFLRGIFGVVTLPHRNASAPVDATLDPGLEAEFRAAREAEFALYDRVARYGRLTLDR